MLFKKFFENPKTLIHQILMITNYDLVTNHLTTYSLIYNKSLSYFILWAGNSDGNRYLV